MALGELGSHLLKGVPQSDREASDKGLCQAPYEFWR